MNPFLGDAEAALSAGVADMVSTAGAVGTAAIGIFIAIMAFRVAKKAFSAGK